MLADRPSIASYSVTNDDVTELVEYVEGERALQQRREERRDAPLWTRAKWWVFGRDRDESKV